jgi:hypothetical protein
MKSCTRFLILLAIIFSASSNTFALGANQNINEEGEIIETFHIDTETHVIALTTDLASLLQASPSNLQRLYENSLVGGVAVLTKITDSYGEVIGFGSELELITTDATGKTTAKTEWTFKIPGRGTILATQTEDLTALIDLAVDMINNGEAARYLSPPLTVVTTVPGTGKIVAGLGEFKNISGTFQETNEITYLNIADGTINLTITLQIKFEDKDKDKD